MKKNSTSSLVVILLLVFAFASCKKEKEIAQPDTTNENSKIEQTEPAEIIVLGKKLEDPYTVENMRLAYRNIAGISGARLSEAESPVRTTHLYLRYLPKNWDEYDQLLKDTTLNLSEVPVDYEIEVWGNNYHDPNIPDTLPTWQYVTVEKDYGFNKSIRHELLAELYIPEEDASLDNVIYKELRIKGTSFKTALINEAMILTKNYADTINTQLENTKTAWTPSGRIQVFDTRVGALIPLQGVKIRVHRWHVYNNTTTDAGGFYRFNGLSYNRPANYSLIFETSTFDVRTGTFGQAKIDGPKSSSPWNLNLNSGGSNRFYAHVFRGAHTYYWGDIGGLKRPSYGMGVSPKLKIAAHNKKGKSMGVNYGNWTIFGANPNISIYQFGQHNDEEYTSDEVFSTTVHEIAHTTHLEIMNGGIIQFSQVSTFIAESWATAVEWQITQIEYRFRRGIADYGTATYNVGRSPTRHALQYWPINSNADYSPIFIDLVDDFNQNNVFFQNFGRATINDQVSGYTLRGIESGFLKHVYGHHSLHQRLKQNRPAGVTDQQIDLLMNSY